MFYRPCGPPWRRPAYVYMEVTMLNATMTVLYKSTARARSATINAFPGDVNSIIIRDSKEKWVFTTEDHKVGLMRTIVACNLPVIARKANQVTFQI